MARKGGNPETYFKGPEVASSPISVKLTPEVDKFVRSLPNRTEWLRKAITEAYERDRSNDQQSA